jgi:hypothetical protein
LNKIINTFLGDLVETKQYITLEVTKGDFNFVFQMPNGASWGNAIDAAFDVLQKLNEMSQQSVQNMKPAVEPVVAEEGD